MKSEDAVKMIELCLESCDMPALIHLTDVIIQMRVDRSTPKKRNYTKKHEMLAGIIG